MAAADYFIKFDGIKGESTDAKHKDEIDIESWSWGETNAGSAASASRARAGKVAMQDFHFVMRLNRASPALMKACATGEHIKVATLTARKSGKGQQEYLIFKFSDVLVSSYQTGGASGGDPVPIDQVSFNFAKVQLEYRPQDATGRLGTAVTAGWDVKANKALKI